MEQILETRNLRVDFDAKEMMDMSHQLATKTRELQALKEEKSSVASQYGAREKGLNAETNKLSTLISDGFQLRPIECKVEYHKPEKGKKTIIRTDTNKIVAVERMEQSEWNLFTQEPDVHEEAVIVDESKMLPAPKKKGNKKRSRKKQ